MATKTDLDPASMKAMVEKVKEQQELQKKWKSNFFETPFWRSIK